MTTHETSPSVGLAPLVGALLLFLAMVLGVTLTLVSLWFAPVSGLALVALGTTVPRRSAPRPVAIVVTVVGAALLVLSALAFYPA